MKKLLLLILGLFVLSTKVFAVTTTDKISYAASVSIDSTFTSLASSATVGQSSANQDNSSNLYDDALVTVKVTTGAGAQANDKAVYVYLYGSEDGTNYEQEESNSPSAKGAYTINSSTIFRGPVVIPVLTASKIYIKTFSVASMWGGVMPKNWGLIFVNFTGQTLAATGNNASFTGITYTNS